MFDTTFVKTSDDLWKDFKMIAGQMIIFAAQTFDTTWRSRPGVNFVYLYVSLVQTTYL